MDTDNTPIFADYRFNMDGDGELTHVIVTTKGTFTLEILRNILAAYKSLSRQDKKRVRALIKQADKTGTPIHE